MPLSVLLAHRQILSFLFQTRCLVVLYSPIRRVFPSTGVAQNPPAAQFETFVRSMSESVYLIVVGFPDA